MFNTEIIPLNAEIINQKIINSFKIEPIFDSINSTSTYIKDNIEMLSHGTVILAEKQSEGRGRYQRKFDSNEGGIYCSFLLKENLSDECTQNINLKIACALHDSIKLCFKIDTQIKWPNDLLINQMKCAGILIESNFNMHTRQYDSLVIGWGLNVYKQEFDDSIKNSATTLENHSLCTLNRNDLIVHFFNNINNYLYHKDIINQYKKIMIPIGSWVYLTLHQNKEEVRIVGLDDNGQLIVADKHDNPITLFNDEILIK